jgi:PAS domain S-box-containing protein
MAASAFEDHIADRRFELLVQSVTDYAIYMLDPSGRIVTWNPGAERFKLYAAAEIVGEHFSRFFTPEDREAGPPSRVP